MGNAADVALLWKLFRFETLSVGNDFLQDFFKYSQMICGIIGRQGDPQRSNKNHTLRSGMNDR